MKKDQSELFLKKDIVKPKAKRMYSENQIVAIRRIRLLKCFGVKWQEVYGRPWLQPPNSWMAVDVPIKQAIEAGYKDEELSSAVDAYFSDKFEFFVSNCHPIRSFTKDIPKWVTKGAGVVKSTNQEVKMDDLDWKLNKEGFIKKSEDNWLEVATGKIYVSREWVIKALDERKRVEQMRVQYDSGKKKGG